MRLVITDSGLGGLSVAAKLFESIKANFVTSNSEILFVNALPGTHQGYNKMKNDSVKIAIFNRFLYGVHRHFSPHFIGIACNTLSAIVEETDFYNHFHQQIYTIIPIAIEAFLKEKENFHDFYIIILGTETTISKGVYQKRLLTAGFNNEQIVPVACPNLASEIELDFKSARTRKIALNCVNQALQNLKRPQRKVYIILGCTHYGYIQPLFQSLFKDAGLKNFKIINPNQAMVQSLLDQYVQHSKQQKKISGTKVKIAIFSKCQILPSEIDSISSLLEDVSPETVQALQNYEIIRDLF